MKVDYSDTVFDSGVVCVNTNNNRYCVVINGEKGTEQDRCSTVMEFDGEGKFVIHTPPNRALLPTGKFNDLRKLKETLERLLP